MLPLTGCAAPGPSVSRVVAEVRAGADRLRSTSYRVVFDLSLHRARWQGTMRTLGGRDAIWSADGPVVSGGAVVDTISVVDAGGVVVDVNVELKGLRVK